MPYRLVRQLSALPGSHIIGRAVRPRRVRPSLDDRLFQWAAWSRFIIHCTTKSNEDLKVTSGFEFFVLFVVTTEKSALPGVCGIHGESPPASRERLAIRRHHAREGVHDCFRCLPRWKPLPHLIRGGRQRCRSRFRSWCRVHSRGGTCLAHTLTELVEQRYAAGRFEVLVADGESTDATPLDCRVVSGAAPARPLAVERAKRWVERRRPQRRHPPRPPG